MSELENRITQRSLMPCGGELFGDRAWVITIQDEGSGEYVSVVNGGLEIKIDADEWPAVRAAIDAMMAEVRS